MTTSFTEEYPAEEPYEPQSFLRTGPDKEGQKAVVPPDRCTCPQFSPPDVDSLIIAQVQRWKRFAALAVKIDPPNCSDQKSDLHAALKTLLDQNTRQNGAVWFAWDAGSGLYACIIPEVDTEYAAELARRIQSDLAENRVETLSVGVTQFPLLDFNVSDTMKNTCKALAHAAFFGAGSIMIFDAVSLNISGDRFYQEGLFDTAIREYLNALRLDPANVNVRNSLAICLAQKGNRDEARASFEEAYRLDSSEAMPLYNIGVLHVLDGNDGPALECFRSAWDIDKQTFDIAFQIGKLLTRKKEYAEAIHFLENAVALRDEAAAAHSLLGRCLASLGRSAEAVNAYKKALKTNPNDAAALSALGVLYDIKGENPEICFTFCRQSIALCPDNGLYRLRLARLHHKHNQLENALQEYETATALGCDVRRQIADIKEVLGLMDS
ncbi:MAG: hypothetical protein VR64_02830 [Desulfatitalea sp. BRH_c12]|nr:MAG: hypothetical protein VR64_02830 [Desulfatitalea sp. BRH_c12]